MKIFILLLIASSLMVNCFSTVKCEDEVIEDVTDEVEVDDETENEELTVTEEIEDDTGPKTTASPFAETNLLFVKPKVVPGVQLEIPAGRYVEFLVGFRNKGKQDFVLDTLGASFRYPTDFNFYIQNFTEFAYNRLVKPGHEATLSYSFLPSEAFASRPFGLNINLNYHDASGAMFQEAVFNETVQVIELEEGFDGETFFLYILLGGLVVLGLVASQQFLGIFGKKKGNKKQAIETGTSNSNNVDYDWIPKQTLLSLNKNASPTMKKVKSPKVNKSSKQPSSPKANNQQSPRQRQVKRQVGSNFEK